MTTLAPESIKHSARQYQRPVHLVVDSLTEDQLDLMTRSRDPHWISVVSTTTHLVGAQLLASLQAVAQPELKKVVVEDFDVNGLYIGTLDNGEKIFFSQIAGHWLIYPRA